MPDTTPPASSTGSPTGTAPRGPGAQHGFGIRTPKPTRCARGRIGSVRAHTNHPPTDARCWCTISIHSPRPSPHAHPPRNILATGRGCVHNTRLNTVQQERRCPRIPGRARTSRERGAYTCDRRVASRAYLP
eukprot:223561-Prymnesium_polylepis.1